MGQSNLFSPFKKFGTTASGEAQLDPQANSSIVQGHGDKHFPAYQKSMFFASNAAGVTTSAGLATTYLGLCLSNPAASTKNLAIRRVSAQLVVITAAATGLGVITGYSAAGVVTHTTANTTLQSSFLGSTTVPQGLVDNACTIVGTPAWVAFLAETASATGFASFNVDFEGAYIIPPGGYFATATTIASATSGFQGSIEWEEFAF